MRGSLVGIRDPAGAGQNCLTRRPLIRRQLQLARRVLRVEAYTTSQLQMHDRPSPARLHSSLAIQREQLAGNRFLAGKARKISGKTEVYTAWRVPMRDQMEFPRTTASIGFASSKLQARPKPKLE